LTEEQISAARSGGSRWDLLAEELQRLRLTVGEPSYAAVAQLVTERRIAAGQPEHSARIARSTVYDCFRPGRVRVNVALVREIAEVLGADDGQVDEWIARCRQPASEPPLQPEEPNPQEQPEGKQFAQRRPRTIALLVSAAVLVNLAGNAFHELLRLPIFLDMVGTAIAAIVLGPWWGALVGVLSNAAGVTTSGTASLPFALVNVVGALMWGYGVRRLGLGRTLPRFFGLGLLVAVACSAVAVPLLLVLFDGSTGHGQDGITATLHDLTGSTALAAAGSNLVVSVGDKLISSFVALVAIAALPAALGARHWLGLLSPEPGAPTEGRR
jgi:energy-coupling factor transport system substrate-specific component